VKEREKKKKYTVSEREREKKYIVRERKRSESEREDTEKGD